MSHVFNIDLDSSYRDRLSYPDCGSFVVPMNPKQTNSSGFNAKDPVILGFPYDTGISLTGPSFNLLGGIQMQLGASSVPIINFYVGNVLQFADYYATIISYDSVTKIVNTITSYNPPSALPTGATTYTIRYKYPVGLNSISPTEYSKYQDIITYTGPDVGTKVVQLGPKANGLGPNSFIGNYLYIQPPVTIIPWFSKLTPTANLSQRALYTYQWSLITGYSGASNTVTLNSPVILTSTGTIGSNRTPYEILNFSYDNAQPLRYAGTDIFSNPRCCRVSLVNCIIPAYLPLVSVNNGYITDYPYVYIAFYSEKERTYNQPIISMSPLSDKALFKVPISPNTDTSSTKFVTLNAVFSTMHVYFKHNDTFRFEIYLPDGTPLRFNPAYYNFLTGNFTFFEGLGFPVPSNSRTNIQASFSISFN